MKIYPIQTGTVRVKTTQQQGQGGGVMRLANVLFGGQWSEPLPIFAWVIDHPEGVIVVDVGETSQVMVPGYFPRWQPYFYLAVRFDVRPEQEIGPQLQKLGISPQDVKKVVLTHLHTDHAGGLHHFPHSQIYLQLAEFQAAQGFTGRLNGYVAHRWPTWLKPTPITFEPTTSGPFPQVQYLTQAKDVFIVPTFGHTPHHVSVVAQYEGVSYFFAGDTSYNQELLLKEQADGVSPDPQQALKTIQAILAYARQQPTIYLPSHDPAGLSRLTNKQTVF